MITVFYSRDDGTPGARPGLWSVTAHSFRTSKDYLGLHTAITLLAYRITGELEDAKDLASECLIAWWQQCRNGEQMESRTYLADHLEAMYRLLQKGNQLRRRGEHQYIENGAVRLPAYEQFRIRERTTILRLSESLAPLEQSVIRLIFWNELEIGEISTMTGKPVPVIKIIQDRAVYKLKKNVLQLSLWYRHR